MRTIVHVDLDAFFAAVEALLHPEYRGKPLVVGGDPAVGRGVVATCSYEARRYGIRSAMPIREAVRRCPHAIFVRPDMKRYAEYSRRFHEALAQFSPRMESLSVDEAFVDMTGCEHFYETPARMAAAIKERVRAATGLCASVGVAPNKFLAKLASDSGKPDGLVVLAPEDVRPFLDALPVERLPGVGPKSAQRLKDLGIRRVRELRERTPEWLSLHVGAHAARHLLRLANGLDDRPVETAGDAKTISRECTFDEDLKDSARIRAAFGRLAADVGVRLRRSGFWAGSVSIKVRFPDFTTLTRRRALPVPLRHDDGIFAAAIHLWRALGTDRPVRLLGVGVGDLRTFRQESLFDQDDRSDRLSATIDAVNRRFGARVLSRGRAWRDES